MPVKSKKGYVKEEGVKKEALTVTFTNGAKAQLEELQKFFETPDSLEIIKLGISFVQKIKEREEMRRSGGCNDSKKSS